MKKSNVYTCTGDGGQTSLADGTRTSKCCARLESYGEVDELNCHVGLLLSLVSNEQIEEMLLEVQRALFSVGAMLATPPQAAHAVRHAVTDEQVHALEHTIDLLCLCCLLVESPLRLCCHRCCMLCSWSCPA